MHGEHSDGCLSPEPALCEGGSHDSCDGACWDLQENILGFGAPIPPSHPQPSSPLSGLGSHPPQPHLPCLQGVVSPPGVLPLGVTFSGCLPRPSPCGPCAGPRWPGLSGPWKHTGALARPARGVGRKGTDPAYQTSDHTSCSSQDSPSFHLWLCCRYSQWPRPLSRLTWTISDMTPQWTPPPLPATSQGLYAPIPGSLPSAPRSWVASTPLHPDRRRRNKGTEI